MDKAVRYMQSALALAPGDPRILNAYATLQSAYGRFDQAIRYYEEAMSPDPLSVPVLSNLAHQLMEAKRLDEARVLIERIEASNPDSFMLDRSIAWLNMSEGNYAAAIEVFEQLPGLAGTWGLALSHAGRGSIEASDQAIEAMRADATSQVAVASVYAYRGEKDRAFDYLEQAHRSDVDAIMEVRMYAAFTPLHDDPRWTALLEQLGLSDADAERLGV